MIAITLALHYLALPDPDDVYADYLDLLAGGGDAPELAPMGPTSRVAGYDLIPLGYLVL